MKADNMLLIQDTQYTISKNVVTIIPDEQLTTTSGTTKIELQFINTKTGEKKATFNLTLKVIPSVLENERTISTATYTLMDELENKLDKAASFFENINKAIDANTTLTATTNNANTSNTNLNTAISAGNTLKTALDGLNTTANATKSNLDTSNNNALATKTALDTSNTNAAATKTTLDASNSAANATKSNLDSSNSTANSTKTDLDKSNANALATKTDLDKLNTIANVTKADLTTVNDKATVTKKDLTDINTTANSTKTDLDAENVRAEENITAMESFGDITALSKNVTNLRAEVETARGGESDLDGRLEKIAAQLSDKANNIDNTRTTTAKDVTGAINELNANMLKKSPITITNTVDILTLTPGYYTVEGAVNVAQNYPYTITWEHFTIIINGWCGTDGKGYKTILLISCSGAIFRNAQAWEASNWSGWKQVSTTESIDLSSYLKNGWSFGDCSFRGKKIGNEMFIEGIIRNSLDSPSSVIAQSLPVPSDTRWHGGNVIGSNNTALYLVIDPSGTLMFQSGGQLKNTFYTICIHYPV
jgi:hypothetical protein